MKHLIVLTVFCSLLVACKKEHTLFERLKSDHTGIRFNNEITENDTLNILRSEFIYNGGGVATGDLNGDGLQDLFFTGNQVDNRCYLNKGNLKFEDITDRAGLAKPDKNIWSAGINLLDINLDGRLDIYVCNTFQKNALWRRNLLYINQGNDGNGVPTFKEDAAAYGLNNDGHTPNAQFFDYDNDGDDDLFLSVNVMDRRNPNAFREKTTDGSDPNCDKLLRNDPHPTLGHPVFTDVSLAAGLKHDGYSHSALISDFNRDGWLDIYVANDYVTNDLLYINNHDGTFTNRVAQCMKHQAGSAMGSDIADVNNDGHLDLFVTEMLPYYNKRKKLFQGPNNYAVYKNNDQYGYEYQYGRNVMQVFQGIDPDTKLPVYGDLAFMTGTQETEWSWTPLLADYDNDGDRDLFVTNGFPRDVTDHDFGMYQANAGNLIAPMDLQEMIPQIKVPKFMFRNDGNMQFSDQSKPWGVDISAFSNGAATADLDNDGDLDLVVNNIDEEVFFFKNTLNDAKEGQKPNYLRVKVEGAQPRSTGFGATATVFFAGQQQSAQVLSARGFSAASETTLHFGLGAATTADSVQVRWPGNKMVTLRGVAANQTIAVSPTDARAQQPWLAGTGLFRMVDTKAVGLNFVQNEDDFVDFDHQRTLPHKFSQYGPGLAVGDVNGDGLDDMYQGGTGGVDGMFFIAQKNGTFVQKAVNFKTNKRKLEEELGVLLFDADGDGDNDLMAVHGGAQNPANHEMYQDRLYVNDGTGRFTRDSTALPVETTNGTVLKAADIDGDGDLDVLVGGSMIPRSYPRPDRSFILRNDSKGKDKPLFTDVTAQLCPELANIGLLNDALFTDFNNDGQVDLLLAGEWMPLTFLKNEGGQFKNVTASTGIGGETGWWSGLAAADFDNDGDTDYMAGNYGKNLYFQCQANEPIRLYAKDFDNNGFWDPFISCYWRDSVGQKHEYFYHTRDDMIRQLISIRKKFFGYGDFGTATVQDVFSPKELEGAIIHQTTQLATCYVENLGNGQFKTTALPWQTQVAPVFGILPHDADGDGLLDVLLVGNDYNMELLQGRADAFNGLLLKNAGNGQFIPVSMQESHFFVPNDARALVRLFLPDGQTLVAATQNRNDMRVFAAGNAAKVVRLAPGDTKVRLQLANGKTRVQEFYYGQGFLSQQQRAVALGGSVTGAVIVDGKGQERRAE